MSAREPNDREREVHERRRAELVARIPPTFRPAAHFALPSLFGVAVCGGAAALLRDVRPLELLVLPLTLLLGFGFEWRLHRTVLHRRRPGLGLLYERHELLHHVVFTYDDMALRSPRETMLVLLPTFAIVAAFVGVVPIAIGLALALSTNTALLFLSAAMAFFLSYEWLHLAYHLPPSSRVGRLRVVAALRELHRRHHDPALMKRWNFNVTLPLFDWLHGTLWSAARAEKKQGSPAAASPTE